MVIVPVEPGICPCDGSALVEHEETQPALFRHGGYGASARVTVAACPLCSWYLLRERQEIRP